jgi:glycine/serine hydroxymethyltransferase
MENFPNSSLASTDPDLLSLLKGEESRQREEAELIASENYVSRAH